MKNDPSIERAVVEVLGRAHRWLLVERNSSGDRGWVCRTCKRWCLYEKDPPYGDTPVKDYERQRDFKASDPCIRTATDVSVWDAPFARVLRKAGYRGRRK